MSGATAPEHHRRRFDAPIAALQYPKRLEWVIEERGIETVRDLVAFSPEQVAKMNRCGPKTVLATERAVQAFLGMSWREAHMTIGAATPGFDTLLATLPCPKRLRWLIATRRATTLGDLARLRPEEILATRNCGQGTVAETDSLVRTQLGISWDEARERLEASPPRHALTPHWQTALASMIAQLDDEASAVIRHALGVGRASPEPTALVAVTLGITRRRARRVELEACAALRRDERSAAVTTRLKAALRGGVVSLLELGVRDPFFHADREKLAMLARFIDVVAERSVRTFHLRGELVVSAFEPDEVAWRIAKLRDEVARVGADPRLVESYAGSLAARMRWPRNVTRDLLVFAARAVGSRD